MTNSLPRAPRGVLIYSAAWIEASQGGRVAPSVLAKLLSLHCHLCDSEYLSVVCYGLEWSCTANAPSTHHLDDRRARELPMKEDAPRKSCSSSAETLVSMYYSPALTAHNICGLPASSSECKTETPRESPKAWSTSLFIWADTLTPRHVRVRQAIRVHGGPLASYGEPSVYLAVI